MSWKCVSMLMWLCAFAPLPWSRSADNLTLAARLDCEWVSPHCGVGLLSSIAASSGILNTIDNKVFWVEESLKYQWW